MQVLGQKPSRPPRAPALGAGAGRSFWGSRWLCGGSRPRAGGDGRLTAMLAAGHRADGGRGDSEIRNFVAQSVAMHAERARGAANVAGVGFQRSDDELFLELPARLFESDALADQLIHDLKQTSVQ